VLVVEVDERIAMNTVNREYDHYGEIGNEQRGVKAVPGIESAEGLVSGLHPQKMAEAILRGEEGQMQCYGQSRYQARGEVQTVCNRSEQNKPPKIPQR